MSKNDKGGQRPSTESIVRIIEDGERIIKGGNNLPTFQVPPPPPKTKK
jgi:hypothetical protein